MECNRDEALRAKEIAEKKMINNDFEGARKIALKARKLFPELDNISQLISVCDVHCSAQRKIYGVEKDLYGILQVENVADEATIKKQYRKLALILHPDKNKFPGAEAAFKLIGEANMTLSDKGKRSVYDVKCREPARASVTKLQNHQNSQTNPKNKNPHVRTQSGAQNNFNDVSVTNHHKQTASNSTSRPSFWTYCPFCNIKYEYYRDFINRPLRCQHCSKLFIAYDIGAQGAAPGHHFVHEEAKNVNLGSKSNRAQPAFPQQKQEKVKVNIQKDGQFPSHFAHTTRTEDVKQNGHINTESGRESVTKAKVNAQKPKEAGVSKDKNKKRKRKIVAESSDSEGEKDEVEEEAVRMNDNSKSGSEANSDPGLVDIPDPEFTNFDKDKEEDCFKVDQVWACYDTIDSMPRFYAQIRKVYSSSFKLRITWFEADPENAPEIKWAEEGLPVACGRFVRGKTEETKDRLMFSHQITYEKGKTRFSYLIYPKKGEIWALFKDWDISWSSDPESHKKYKFDIMEILDEHDNGVSVAYLAKVKGFVSLFQRTNRAENKIPTSEIFRFSHRVPSVKLTGTERAGVPPGSFELDTAALPGDLDDYYYFYSKVVNMEEKVKPTTGLAGSPNKPVNSEAKNGLDKETFNLRRSPRGLKGGDKANGATPSKPDNPFCEDSDINTFSKNFTKSPKISSSSSACRKLEPFIHDFNEDKQFQKFQVGQIWAFYKQNEGIHHCYAEIKHIESEPLRLHVSLLKLCSLSNPSNYGIRNDACGTFKVSPSERKVFPPDLFSHIVKADICGKNMFNIYPRKQEIWGLYKRQEGGEYDIVEVTETDESSIKVSSLARVPGYKSVFKATGIKKSIGKIVVIPRIELKRFSHQIPAFHFTEANDSCYTRCWELDPAALAGLPSCA